MSSNRIPSLINGSAGKPTSGVAGKRFPCKGCGEPLAKGEKYFLIPNPRKAFGNPKRFCPACFLVVLQKTKADVAVLEIL